MRFIGPAGCVVYGTHAKVLRSPTRECMHVSLYISIIKGMFRATKCGKKSARGSYVRNFKRDDTNPCDTI